MSLAQFICALQAIDNTGGPVNEFAGGRGGDERGGGGVVERAEQPGGDPVQPGDRVVGEQRLLPADQGQVRVAWW